MSRLIAKLAIFPLFLFALAFDLTPVMANAVSCPSTASGWNDWRTSLVTHLKSPNDLGDGRVDLLTSCQSQPDQKAFFEDPSFLACMRPIQNVAAQAKLVHDDDVNTSSVFEEQAPQQMGPSDWDEVKTIPPIFSQKEFIAAANNSKLTEKNVAALMAEIQTANPGSLIARMNSHFGISDRSILIKVPNENVDRWIHLTWDGQGLAQVMFMVSVEKEDRDGKKLTPPRVFFNAFTYSPDTFSAAIMQEIRQHQQLSPTSQSASAPLPTFIPRDSGRPARLSAPVMACYGCHRTGAMPLVPDDKSPKLFSYTPGIEAPALIQAMNAEVAKTASAIPPTIQNAILHDRLGPAVGPINPPIRDDHFMSACAPNASPASRSKIKAAMNCSGCHDATSSKIGFAGKLSYPMGVADGITTLINPGEALSWMVKSGHMPPGANLAPDERSALVSCLVDEYYGGTQTALVDPAFKTKPGLFINSLTQISCPTDLPAAQSQSGSTTKTIQGDTGSSQSPSAPSNSGIGK